MGDRLLIAAGTMGPAFERASSSDGRASALQAEGRGFDALLVHAEQCSDSGAAEQTATADAGCGSLPTTGEGPVPCETAGDDGGTGAHGEHATPGERGHGTPAGVATYNQDKDDEDGRNGTLPEARARGHRAHHQDRNPSAGDRRDGGERRRADRHVRDSDPDREGGQFGEALHVQRQHAIHRVGLGDSDPTGVLGGDPRVAGGAQADGQGRGEEGAHAREGQAGVGGGADAPEQRVSRPVGDGGSHEARAELLTSGQPGRGDGGDVVRTRGPVGNGADRPYVPASGEADLRKRIRELERQVASLRTQVKWWQDRAAEPTTERGCVVSADAAAGQIGYARQAGAAEQRLRAAARLLRRVAVDPAAADVDAWREEVQEVLRFVEGLDRG